MAGQRVGVTAGVARLDVGERGLRNERAQPDVLGFLLEDHELLLGDVELGADALEALAHVDEAALQDRLRHRRGVYDAPPFRVVLSDVKARRARSSAVRRAPTLIQASDRRDTRTR